MVAQLLPLTNEGLKLHKHIFQCYKMRGEENPLVAYLHIEISQELRESPTCVQGHARGSALDPLSAPNET